MDEERKKLAKKYEKIKLTVRITEGISTFILLVLFIALGFSKQLEQFVYTFTSNHYFALFLYLLVFGVVSTVITFPVDYYFGFRLEHKFGLSNQTFKKWIIESLKSAAVGIVLGAPILLLFYYLLLNYELWWFWLGCIILIYSVVLAQIAPVVIMPLFYKFKPIENESLKEKILALCDKVGFKVKGVYTFDMSKNTKKANSAFTGLGKSKRIILGDTLISGFSEDEIETVFAHELGHYKKGHITKNIIISIFSTFISLYVVSYLYNNLFQMAGFEHTWDIAALPLLAVIGSVMGFFTKPFWAYISRRYEFEADKFAIMTTGNFTAFKSTMEKLAFQNLANEEPSKLVEIWFYSHPSIKRRIEAGERYYITNFNPA
ncbi:MAG: M48 family peptidase [Ignavibacteriae bacterium]|nr:MAG: M48 family peptidase [Ignavibacteriota bacterium]